MAFKSLIFSFLKTNEQKLNSPADKILVSDSDTYDCFPNNFFPLSILPSSSIIFNIFYEQVRKETHWKTT